MRFNSALSRHVIENNLKEIVAITHALIYCRDWATLDRSKATDRAAYLLEITCDDAEAKSAIINIAKEKDDYVKLLDDLLDTMFPFAQIYSLVSWLRIPSKE